MLDAGLVAHVAVVDEGQPFVVPVAYARRGDEVVFHGSTGSRLMRSLAAGAPTCLTVSLLDGIIVARSAFESSMNYRSVMVLGTARRLEGDDEADALRVITEHLTPGRWSVARPMAARERAATMVLALSLDEASVKINDEAAPHDDPDDVAHPVYGSLWAGVVPITESFGTPTTSPDCPEGTAVPDSVAGWRR